MPDDDGPQDRQAAFMSALVTEHFVLQSAASSTISEAGSRSSIYLMSLSSSLVALGFTTQASPGTFAPFAAAVLPAVFLLGCFSVVRLVDTSIANVMALRRIARIRRYYAGLVPEAAEYFPSDTEEAVEAQNMLGVRYNRASLWFTMASTIGTVNAVLGGTMTALLLEAGVGVPRAVAVGCGVVVALALAFTVVRYERQRFAAALAP